MKQFKFYLKSGLIATVYAEDLSYSLDEEGRPVVSLHDMAPNQGCRIFDRASIDFVTWKVTS